MKNTKEIFYCLLLVAVSFLGSCDSVDLENANESVLLDWGILSPISQILEMPPVKITFSRTIERKKEEYPKIKTKQDLKRVFDDPKNFKTILEVTDINDINSIMTALSGPSVGAGAFLSDMIWMKFTDKHGITKKTMIRTVPNDLCVDINEETGRRIRTYSMNKVYLVDRTYGEASYEILNNFLEKAEKNLNSEIK